MQKKTWLLQFYYNKTMVNFQNMFKFVNLLWEIKMFRHKNKNKLLIWFTVVCEENGKRSFWSLF